MTKEIKDFRGEEWGWINTPVELSEMEFFLGPLRKKTYPPGRYLLIREAEEEKKAPMTPDDVRSAVDEAYESLGRDYMVRIAKWLKDASPPLPPPPDSPEKLPPELSGRKNWCVGRIVENPDE